MENSKIAWCDHTFNAWEGCTKVAPECKNCYAENHSDKRFHRVRWGRGNPRRRTGLDCWKQPNYWNQYPWICDACGTRHSQRSQCGSCKGEKFHRARVFTLSLGDWLDDEVPITWFIDLLNVIRTTPNLVWMLLTKRPGNFDVRMRLALDYLEAEDEKHGKDFRDWIDKWINAEEPPPRVWIGVSAGCDFEDGLEIPAALHFLSCEPMLAPLDVNRIGTKSFDWIIFGGESGHGNAPRSSRLEWYFDGLKFCRDHEIAPFIKQLGKNCFNGKDRINLKEPKGGDPEEWPETLRVREFPITDDDRYRDVNPSGRAGSSQWEIGR